MSRSCTIVVRSACAADGAARAALVRASVMHHMRDAFFMFLFQELTLQLCVLGGAVLFIFCGASVVTCCVLVPVVAALVVYISVYFTHIVLADKHVVDMRQEIFGLVAELRGPLLVDPSLVRPPVIVEDTFLFGSTSCTGLHTKVVGSVSVSELHGPARGGWLHALAVHEQWRRRGVGRALVRAAAAARRGAGDGAGDGALLAALSALHSAATSLLHNDGWEVRGSYQRPVLGAALTLPVLLLGLEPRSHA